MACCLVAYLLAELIDGGISRRFVQILSGISSSILILLSCCYLFIWAPRPSSLHGWLSPPSSTLSRSTRPCPARGGGVFWFAASFVILLSLVIDLINHQNLQIQNARLCTGA